MVQDLQMEIDLVKNKAAAQAKAFAEDIKRMNATMVADAKKSQEIELDAYKATASAKKSLSRGTMESEVRDTKAKQLAEAEAIEASRKAKQQADEEAKKLNKELQASSDAHYASVVAGAALGVLAVKKMVDVVQELSDKYKEVAAKQRAMVTSFSSDRDQLRELASAENKQLTDEFTIDVHKFAKGAAMSFQEAVRFKTEYANEAIGQKGVNISAIDYAEYEKTSAVQAARVGALPTEAAQFAGSFLTKPTTAAKAAHEQAVVASIYEAGAGDPGPNWGAFGRLSKQGLTGPGAAYKDANELAIAGSIANAAGQGNQEHQIEVLTRNLRDPTNKELQALLKRGNIDPNTTIVPMIKAIAPMIREEIAKTGQGLDIVLDKYMPDERGKRALAIQLSQGVFAGGYTAREKVAQENEAPGTEEVKAAKWMASKPARDRVVNAEGALVTAQIAAKNSEVEILEKQAANMLKRSGRIDTEDAALQEWMAGKSMDVLAVDTQRMIRNQTQSLILGRLPEADREDFKGSFESQGAYTPAAQTEMLRNMAIRARERGVDPLQAAQGGDSEEYQEGSAGLEGVMIMEGMKMLRDRKIDRISTPRGMIPIGGQRAGADSAADQADTQAAMPRGIAANNDEQTKILRDIRDNGKAQPNSVKTKPALLTPVVQKR